MTWEIREGDAIERLRELADESVHCCVTSPPYWGLRDYGTEGQLGLERTYPEFVANMVEVFREVRRVLRSDGVLWLNLGDCYATGAGKVGAAPGGGNQGARWAGVGDPHRHGRPGGQPGVGPMTQPNRLAQPGLKPKDLVGIPWRVALALQDDGWWLRRDVVWAKPNAMPESAKDRPATAHEYVFQLTKAARYFYDDVAVRQPDRGADHPRQDLTPPEPSGGLLKPHRGIRQAAGRNGLGANLRSVWHIATKPYADAHFATFPPELVEPCIRATAPESVCGECGAPWRRVTKTSYENPGNRQSNGPRSAERKHIEFGTAGYNQRLEKQVETLGFEATCDHADGGGMATVLDPFSGAGTTGLVAARLGRDYIGIELNPEYAELSRRRIRDDAPLLNVAAEVAA